MVESDDPLARELAKLQPATPETNLPALMYRAGQASRNRAVAMWQTAFTLAIFGLAGTWATVMAFPERLQVVPNQIPVTPHPEMDGSNLASIGRAMVSGTRSASPPSPAIPSRNPQQNPLVEYLQIQDNVLTNGLAGLPVIPPPPEPISAAEMARWVTLFH